ncbi:tetratricopeptide repeat protein [Colwellia sp. PAMC 21821]|uniref:tetratricopeptide repeat protein n=1 Tax=Colwellia sp. PAMC 21821 TaxID=1816219 RepID=UPI0009BD996C|nr:tetratricopeptide repeat protein [Colwellia sp. PAMC 21821]ARD44816.1 hypothetical protein A3Q33_11160 [Colwellia sp. PAMC 21821]
MKKLILLLVCMVSHPLYASIEQGITAFENGNLPLAKSILLKQSDKGYQKPFYLALIAAKSGEWDEAEEYIKQAIELDAKNAEVQFTYAKIMAEQAEASSIFSLTGYIKKVKKAFKAAVELAPENIEYRSTLIRFHINAPSMLGGDINQALQHAQVLKGINALAGTIALIQVHGKMENTIKFNEEIKMAALNFVNEPELYYQLGLYYQENESFNEALIYFRKTANMATSTEKQQDAKYSAIFQLGRTSILSDSNFDEGKDAFTQYLNEANVSASMPSKNWAKFRLANIIESQGEESKAIRLYKDLVQESSDKSLQKAIQKRIEKIS